MSDLDYMELQKAIIFLMSENKKQMEVMQSQLEFDQLHASKVCGLLKRIEELEERVACLEKEG